MSDQLEQALQRVQNVADEWLGNNVIGPADEDVEILRRGIEKESERMLSEGFLPLDMPCGCCVLAGFAMKPRQVAEKEFEICISLITRPEVSQCH